MKQGKSLQELGRELQRQRNNRQDFLADTRSLEMTSGHAGSILHLSLNDKSTEYGVGEVAHQQIAARLKHSLSLLPKNAERSPRLARQKC